MKFRIKTEFVVLVLLFLFVLGFRLYFSFNETQFNTDGAYFHLRQINYILQEHIIQHYDSLSYGGRELVYPPLFHILLALMSFGSIFLLKLIPEIFMAFNFFIVYLIAKEIRGNKYVSMFSALLASFYPILFTETLNNLSIHTLFIPLVLVMLYSLLKLEDKKYLWIFIILSFILPLIHPAAIIIVFTLLIYFLLLIGGALSPSKYEREAALFCTFTMILIYFLLYKKIFWNFGANVLWQNVPSNILSDSFRNMTSIDLLVGIGLIPLILGAIGIYFSFIKEKKKVAYLFAAFSLAVLFLVVARFLTLNVGLMFLGILLSIFAAQTLGLFYSYLNNLRFAYVKYLITFVLLILFVVSSFLPSFVVAETGSEIARSKIKEVNWLIYNTENETTVLGNLNEGNLITAIANRKNVIDDNFLLAPDPINRNKDISLIYTTSSEAIAISYIKKYNIDVIYLSDDTKNLYNITDLKYANNSLCFESQRGGTYYVLRC